MISPPVACYSSINTCSLSFKAIYYGEEGKHARNEIIPKTELVVLLEGLFFGLELHNIREGLGGYGRDVDEMQQNESATFTDTASVF